MKLTIQIDALELVRERMGAPLSSWNPQSAPAKWEPFQKTISHHEIAEVQPLDGEGPLVYQGKQVLLYIKDTRLDQHTLRNDPENSRRFHIADCRTLERMRDKGNFERYVATNELSGRFEVEATDPVNGKIEKLKAELYVCKNCLDKLGLTDNRTNWPSFSISAFFRDHETFFCSLPRHTDITAPPGGYPKNWRDISGTYKTLVRRICENCKVNLARQEHRQMLHCHHRNGVTSDNTPENLQALCVECHSEQPGHGQYPPSDDERELLARLREEQGIRDGRGGRGIRY